MDPLRALELKLAYASHVKAMRQRVGPCADFPTKANYDDEDLLASVWTPVVWSKSYCDVALTAFHQFVDAHRRADVEPALVAPIVAYLHVFDQPPFYVELGGRMWPIVAIGALPIGRADGSVGMALRGIVRFDTGEVHAALLVEYDPRNPARYLEHFSTPGDRREAMSLLSWAQVADYFLSQVVEVEPAPIPRQARRALARRGEESPLVYVVKLRRAVTKDAPATPEGVSDVEWQCKWLVRGHWRKQWCPSKEQHEMRWIAPYIKGPEDKPFREHGPLVYEVAR